MSDPVAVTLIEGLLIGSAWKKAGSTIQLPKKRADRFVALGKASLGGSIDAPKNDPTPFENEDFPGADSFAEAGITTIAGVRELIEKMGDGWHAAVKGIGKGTARQVAEALQPEEESGDKESAEDGK